MIHICGEDDINEGREPEALADLADEATEQADLVMRRIGQLVEADKRITAQLRTLIRELDEALRSTYDYEG